MSAKRINSIKLEPEALYRFNSVVAKQTSKIQRILRYYYAGSTLIFQMDLSPLLELNEKTLSKLFMPFGDNQLVVKNGIVSKTMDLLIKMVCLG